MEMPSTNSIYYEPTPLSSILQHQLFCKKSYDVTLTQKPRNTKQFTQHFNYIMERILTKHSRNHLKRYIPCEQYSSSNASSHLKKIPCGTPKSIQHLDSRGVCKYNLLLNWNYWKSFRVEQCSTSLAKNSIP
ncbi:hypothetical protein Cni_G13808 [Canna indica]|uniref:Uncharacterized protein n=1 Tax=Canna indica TaxID=4628 RepID=A0AAQ3QBT9_9LILI|nr:hypothetical protein Cni_G13808 [Canna indica]